MTADEHKGSGHHVLLIGSGGREHALAWKLSTSPRVARISVVPGNPGMAKEPGVSCIDLDINDHDALIQYAMEQQVFLTVVGPEAPLVAGFADRFLKNNLPVVGPVQAAAQLEGSKAFAKQFMQQNNIPTAAYASFTDVDAALSYLAEQPVPIVVKADGLAAGKGVVVADNHEMAAASIKEMLSGNAFGAAGHRVVIEEFMVGEEASFIALVDGKHCVPFATSQDHKARDDGDQGPNTGGMGAYSPAPVVTPAIEQHIMQDIIEPTIAALAADGAPYCGFLYAGLMIDPAGKARVVEFNVRLGDPETQPLLMRLDSDLYTMLEAAAAGQLDQVEANWSIDAALGVVLAAGSYPASGSQGEAINGIEQAEASGCKVFHAGTRVDDGVLVTAGGRVLCVTARGADIAEAKQLADSGAAAVNWPNRHYRKDIGYRAIARLADSSTT